MRHLITLLTIALASATAHAHDFWIQASSFAPPVNTQVQFDLRVGDDYPGESLPRNPKGFEKFIVVGPGVGGAERAVVGTPGQQPAGAVRFTEPGVYTVGYRSIPTAVEIEAAKFELYLTEKGLKRAKEARAASGATGEPGREVFSRCAKALVTVGSGEAEHSKALGEGFDRALGMRLELIAVTNPATMTGGGDFTATLVYEGAPREGVLVTAVSATNPTPTAKLSAVTDSQGRVSFKLSSPGLWVLNAVEMVPAKPDTKASPKPDATPVAKADWESLWASLTFELPKAPSATELTAPSTPTAPTAPEKKVPG